MVLKLFWQKIGRFFGVDQSTYANHVDENDAERILNSKVDIWKIIEEGACGSSKHICARDLGGGMLFKTPVDPESCFVVINHDYDNAKVLAVRLENKDIEEENNLMKCTNITIFKPGFYPQGEICVFAKPDQNLLFCGYMTPAYYKRKIKELSSIVTLEFSCTHDFEMCRHKSNGIT